MDGQGFSLISRDFSTPRPEMVRRSRGKAERRVDERERERKREDNYVR